MSKTNIISDLPTDHCFDERLKKEGIFPLKASTVSTLQVNLGRMCNQACKHCHVEAGPDRTEIMDLSVVDACIKVIKDNPEIKTVDLTGGAPEMNPHFRYLVKALKSLDRHIIVRSNLTILLVEGMEDLPMLFKDCRAEVCSSLPYFEKTQTDRQRGGGVFDDSIKAMKLLNAQGYGADGSGLVFNLVYNPGGAILPSGQHSLESEFKKNLKDNYDVVFNNLFTITNMPIGRFYDFLKRSGNLDNYMSKLDSAFNKDAALGAMCTNLVSVDWQGNLFDCDFNQMLDIKCKVSSNSHIESFDFKEFSRREIVTGPHCFGCTAGAGSSCGGTLA